MLKEGNGSAAATHRQARWLAITALIGTLALSAAAASGGVVSTQVLEDTPDHIVIRYDLGDFTQTPVFIDHQQYTKITLGKESISLTAGEPELPTVCRSVRIPDDAEMDIRVLSSEFKEYTGIHVIPSKGSLPRTINPAGVPYTFGSAYSQDAFYPGQLATLRSPYILRDLRGQTVVLNPFQYNPVTMTLHAYTSVTVEVFKTGPGQTNVLQPSHRKLSRAFNDLYKHQFLNPGLRYDPLDEEGDLLIICYDAWLPNIAPLVEHKNSIGIETTAVGVSTIGSSSTAIKDYIQNLYDTTDLAFVLLVGDIAQIPSVTVGYAASDPSYCKLAGGDDYPEIMIGRFSAENAGQVDTQVLRTIQYEDDQATTQDWFWKGTGIASSLGAGAGDEGQSDYDHEDEIRDWLLDFGYTHVDQLYDTVGATAAQVTAALNEGRGIVNYTGHGWQGGWSSTGFGSTDVNALVNDGKLPFVISVACYTGEFHTGTCFGEAWLRATNGATGQPTGAIGFYGSTISQDWAPPMEGQDEFNILYTSPEEPYHFFGTLCFAGSCSMMDAYGSGGVTEFNHWTVFGDPTVRIIGVSYLPPVKIDVPDGLPRYLDPGQPTTLVVQIDDGRETLAPDSALLNYRYDDGDFISVPLVALGDSLYEATLPVTTCDDVPEFYFSAQGDLGTMMYWPGTEDAPEPWKAVVATVTVIFDDNFETDLGWTVVDTAVESGSWERGTPIGGDIEGAPKADFDGSGMCFLTGNMIDGDIDGGPTRLVSPIIDLSGTEDPVLTFAWWWYNDDQDLDYLVAQVSSNGGTSWSLLARIFDHDDEPSEWIPCEYHLADYIPLTSEVQIRFSASDTPNNSIDEAAVDAVRIIDVTCSLGHPGDLNCDGVVDYADIDPFVEALSCVGGVNWPYDCPWTNADCNGDGEVNYDDIDAFVALIGS